ncbi:hypothetical protein ACJRO7_001888 [Eucalyptus globulus]|uniref:Secreted protein n=1 Tax=Eucalyptus globulus TaxID=34317 RepID=A0ABD3LSF0_EUCGL
MFCSTAATTTMSRVLLFLVVFWALFTGFDGRILHAALPATSGNEMNSGHRHTFHAADGGHELYVSTRIPVLLDRAAPEGLGQAAPGGPNAHHN